MTIKEKLDIIKYNIEKSVEKSGRNVSDVTILPVSKRKTPDEIREVLNLGIKIMGENYVQEFVPKYEELKNEVDEFHFIGHLQKNKVKYILGKTSLIHSVDSISLMEEISKRAEKLGIIQDVLIEVNFEGEETKTGLPKSELHQMLEKSAELKGVKVRGLMTMPPAIYTSDELKRVFSSFRELYEKEKQVNYGENIKFDTLSMGMSNDYPEAVENGATIVRIGTALFGKRD